MSRSRRVGRNVLALPVVLWTQACTVYRPPPAAAPLGLDVRLRVRSTVPFALSRPAGSLTALAVCHVTAFEGDVRRAVSDTLVLEYLSGVALVPGPDGSRRRCPEDEALTLVRTPTMELAERRVHTGRTTALILGIVAVLIAFAAYGASQIETGFPSSR